MPDELDLERWQIRVPKTGNQGEYRGEEAFVFDLDVLAGDQLERSLRRVNPSLRRHRPIIYRGPRQLAADLADDDDRLLATAKASSQDPEEAAQILAIRELRELRRTLASDCEARRREIDRLEAASTKLRDERDRELERIENQILLAQQRGQRLVKESQDHHEEELRRVRRTRGEIDAQATADLGQIGQQIQVLTQARAQLNQILHAPSAADFLATAKEWLVAIADSPVAEAAVTHVSARMAAAMSKRTGEPIEVQDVLATFVLQGRAARARLEKLREFKFEDLIDPRRAELVLAGCEYYAGDIDLKTVVNFIRRDVTLATR